MATSLKDIQRHVGVTPDGTLGPATLAAIAKELGIEAGAKALHSPQSFFTQVRKAVFGGSLSTPQVDGLNILLDAFGRASWGLSWCAYGLATAAWETNRSMQPVQEAYFLGDKQGAAYRAKLRYAPWWGRGYPQVTWEKNYRACDAALGLGGALILDPDMMLRSDIAARATVWGMETGAFTGKGLADYLPDDGFADTPAFREARRIINGTDKASEIAAIALKFQDALQMGDWG
jgi:putative chitinase